MKNLSIFISLLLLLAACKPAEKPSVKVEDPTLVTVTKAENIEYKIPVHASGILGTSSQMKLSFKTGGIIRDINTNEGAAVKKGKLLARLDLAEITAQVEQAKIGEEKAQRDLNRAKNLYADSVATLEQYQNAQSAYKLARSMRRIADFNLQHSTITAPANGKIQKILVENNELIAPGYPAIIFASTEDKWVVRVAVTDKDIVKLSIADSALITMDAFPRQSFKAEISQLASVANPVSGTFEVELLIFKTHPEFRSGFISRVEIFPANSKKALVVPIETLLNANKLSASVFIHVDGKAQERKVEIGEIIDNKVVITAGLREGEEIINAGAHYLKDDSPVQIKAD